MSKVSSIFLIATTLAGLSSLVSAQTGPQLTVGPGLIYTVAGSSTSGLSPMVGFTAVAFKSPATLYIADTHLANVYAVNLNSGQVTRVAGNGSSGFCTAGTPASCPGDGGPATSALLGSGLIIYSQNATIEARKTAAINV